ncbi:hypothetical protein ACHAXA_004803 [Cyclostephanos tholiformis]|uniref:Sulfotransferase domain-containing protein n=1 Tax=Cyclostephanos tholiformis TaxID=382380 RepID=A0ABD3RWQ9_9STRA
MDDDEGKRRVTLDTTILLTPPPASLPPSSSSSTGNAPPGLGSNPPIYRYEDLPVPWWFNPSTALLYKNVDVMEDDVVLSSGVKMGTTWLARILVMLMHDDDGGERDRDVDYACDDAGGPTSSLSSDDRAAASADVVVVPAPSPSSTTTTTVAASFPGRYGQTYPDATYPSRIEKSLDSHGIYDRIPNGRDVADAMFGDFVWTDLLDMPRPRLFVSHLFGRRYLPRMLFDGKHDDGDVGGDAGDDDAEDGTGGYKDSRKLTRRRRGKGRLIVLVRNLKDTLISLHNFRGTAIDGMLGNEHGPGSYHRFINLESCPNAMGSAFHWIRRNDEAVNDIGPDRAMVVYYERLVLDFVGELRRINAFLGLRHLTDERASAIEGSCSIESMRDDVDLRVRANCRRGGVCGWKDVAELNDDEHWSRFDDVFDEVLGGVKIAEPLRSYQTR